MSIADGPSGYAYGRVNRIAADIIEFSVEATDIAVTLTPRLEEAENFCG